MKNSDDIQIFNFMWPKRKYNKYIKQNSGIIVSILAKNEISNVSIALSVTKKNVLEATYFN